MNDPEVFIEGYEDRYTISSTGRIFTYPDHIEKAQFQKIDGGIFYVELWKGKTKELRSVPRLVFTHFAPDHFDEFKRIRFRDGDPSNNDIMNLDQGSQYSYRPRRWRRNALRVRIAETGETFRSVSAAAGAVDGHATAIYRNIKGKQKSHMGYTFEPINEPIIKYNDRKFDA